MCCLLDNLDCPNYQQSMLGNDCASLQPAASSPLAEADAETWAGEGYEQASATGADSMYLKFSKRLQRCPNQCLRYR